MKLLQMYSSLHLKQVQTGSSSILASIDTLQHGVIGVLDADLDTRAAVPADPHQLLSNKSQKQAKLK